MVSSSLSFKKGQNLIFLSMANAQLYPQKYTNFNNRLKLRKKKQFSVKKTFLFFFLVENKIQNKRHISKALNFGPRKDNKKDTSSIMFCNSLS